MEDSGQRVRVHLSPFCHLKGVVRAELKRMLSMCPHQIGDSVFVHGGLRIKHVEYGLEKLNRETAAWLEGAPRFKVSPSSASEKGMT